MRTLQWMFFELDVLHRKILLWTCGIHCIAIIRVWIYFLKIRKRNCKYNIIIIADSPFVIIENFLCQNQWKKFLPLKRWKPPRPNPPKLSLKIESVTIKMTHFVFRVTQKHFIKCVLHVRVSRLLHIMKNKMCHFDCNGLNWIVIHLCRILKYFYFNISYKGKIDSLTPPCKILSLAFLLQ
jgi:hypothetical protein